MCCIWSIVPALITWYTDREQYHKIKWTLHNNKVWQIESMLTFSPAIPVSPAGPTNPGSPWRREITLSQLSLISFGSTEVRFLIICCTALGFQWKRHTQRHTVRASDRNQQKEGEKPLPSRQAFRPRQLSRSRPTAKQTISISQTYSCLRFSRNQLKCAQRPVPLW